MLKPKKPRSRAISAVACALMAAGVSTGVFGQDQGHGAASGAAGGETLRHEAVIDGPVHEVWKAFTTTGGLKSWMAPLADIDLRVGGKMRAKYQATGELGDEQTIENTILSFEPERMLSIKATKPPAGFPFAAAIQDMWSVIYFQPIGADRTRVSISGMGFRDDEESARMRAFFEQGNAVTLEHLRKKFAKAAGGNQSDALQVLRRLVGGDWIFENKRDDGSVFRVRTLVEQGPHESVLVAKGWLGNAEGMFHHAATQIWREPGEKAVRFQSFDEQGALASGEIVAVGDDAVSWDWNMRGPGGRTARYRVKMTFSDSDHFEFLLHEIKSEGSEVERVRVNYARVSELPEAFRRLKSDQN